MIPAVIEVTAILMEDAVVGVERQQLEVVFPFAPGLREQVIAACANRSSNI